MTGDPKDYDVNWDLLMKAQSGERMNPDISEPDIFIADCNEGKMIGREHFADESKQLTESIDYQEDRIVDLHEG